MQKVGLASGDLQRAIEIVPVIFSLPFHHRANPFVNPYPSHGGVEPEARLVHHPHLNPRAAWQLERFQPPAESLFKLLKRPLTPAGVSRAGHPQHPSEFF